MSEIFAITEEQVHELVNEFPGIKKRMTKLYPTMFDKGIYKRGDIFERKGDKYILAHIDDDDSVSLISLKDGNRWSKPLIVNNVISITEDEFITLVGIHYGTEFKLVERN